jgi:hypothetical protein
MEILRRFARRVLRPFRGTGYWQRRKHFNYYKEVVRLAEQHAPAGGRAIDVGAYESDVLGRLTWFEHRVALDLYPIPRRVGIVNLQTDFMEYEPDQYFDLVLCLQVLEHLEEPEAFTRKLLNTGRIVIISVPYNWPSGRCENHLQDPVDEAKLELWTGRKAMETRVALDGTERLIAVYRN